MLCNSCQRQWECKTFKTLFHSTCEFDIKACIMFEHKKIIPQEEKKENK